MTPQQPQSKDWEKEVDSWRMFPDIELIRYDDISVDYIKSFISTLLAEERSRIVREEIPAEDEQGSYYKDSPNVDEVSHAIGWNDCRDEIIKALLDTKHGEI